MPCPSKLIILLTLCLGTATSFSQKNFRRDHIMQMNVLNEVSSRSVIDATIANEGASDQNKNSNGIRVLLERSVEVTADTSVKTLSTRIIQRTDGPVPRSYLPALMAVDLIDANCDRSRAAVFSIIEEGLQWFFDTGGRSSSIEISCTSALSTIVQSMGFIRTEDSQNTASLELREFVGSEKDARAILRCDAALFKSHCEKRILEENSNKYTLYDIIGRLAHDLGDPQGAIKPYTSALQANRKSSATFRNMGSAYHAVGDLKLAFASYQQALQLDETDSLVYLKLAFFYEEFATKDWVDAAKHAQQCYQYYLDKVDRGDTSILTRLGNLLVREHQHQEAVEVYRKTLSVDSSLSNVWFNLANSLRSIGDEAGAIDAFRRALSLNPLLTSARHSLKSLSAAESEAATSCDSAYVAELFNDYAPSYDKHMKKLLYAATRVIRQELATVYRAQFGIFDGRYASDGSIAGLDVPELAEVLDEPEFDGVVRPVSDKAFAAGTRTQKMSDVTPFKEAQGPVGAGCSTYSSFMNKTLDILDLGCGTGGAGAWLKDYARSLVGVDLSDKMVDLARKKMLYQELHVQPLNAYLQTCTKTFDLVVAADVFSYVGQLEETFRQVSKVLRPGGHFTFTLEALPEADEGGANGFKLMKSGRFGHRKQYISDIMEKEVKGSFITHLSRDFSPRLDVGTPVPGFLYIIQKPF